MALDSGGSPITTHGVTIDSGDVAGNPRIELRDIGSGTGTPYIDFSNDASVDFDMRLRLIQNNVLAMEGGNVAIGGTGPRGRFDVQNGNRNTNHPTGKTMYVTGDYLTGDNYDGGIEFRHSNGTQGIGFGYRTIYATGTNINQDLNLMAHGNGQMTINGKGGGKVAVGGVNTNPAGITNGQLIVEGGHVITASPDFGFFSASFDGSGLGTGMDPEAGDDLRFFAGGNEQVRIDGPTGNVGIGTPNPGSDLHVVGDARVTGRYRDSSNDSGAPGQVLSSTGSGTNWVTGGLSSVITREAVATVPSGGGSGTSLGVFCNPGEFAMGGGYQLPDATPLAANFQVVANAPLPATNGTPPIGWQVDYIMTIAGSFSLKVYAVCVS